MGVISECRPTPRNFFEGQDSQTGESGGSIKSDDSPKMSRYEGMFAYAIGIGVNVVELQPKRFSTCALPTRRDRALQNTTLH